MNDSDNFESMFAPEPAQTDPATSASPWKVILVDDDNDFHAVLHLALRDVQVESRPLQLLDANSAAEAKELLLNHHDVALILLDVVMESSKAGLDLVEYIRNDLGNNMVRIMIITGQPGYAPQRDVITRYEIDGSRLKTDLSTDKIFATVYTSLRTFRAITELEQQRRLLEEQTRTLARWGHVFEHSGWGIIVSCVGSKRIELCNPAFARLRGCEVEELLGVPIDSLFPVEEHAKILKYMEMSLEQGHVTFESENLYKGGSLFPVLVDVTAVKNAHGQLLYYVINVQDTTDQKRVEEEKHKLEKLSLNLQKKMSLSRMAGAIAHHFNNRLGVVIGNLEMVLEDLPQTSESAEKLTVAMDGALAAAEISSKLLTYLGQTTGKHEVFDLSDSCRRILSLLHATTPNDLKFGADLPAPGPVVNGSPDQIEQVIVNLVINAFEATEESQGSVHLAIKTASASDTQMKHVYPPDWQPQDNSYGCIEVVDTGCGIASEDIEQLFDPFYSTKFTGRGLGLSLVFGIITAHHGAVAVESEFGNGSTFRVFLPVSTPEVLLRPVSEKIEKPAVQEIGTVLLVDDEKTVLNMACAMLTRLGYKVFPVSDGREAIDLFTEHRKSIDTVICDVSMPGLNGWETVAAIRRIRSDIPVILTSGHDESRVMDSSNFDSSISFLHKPFLKSTLQEVLEKSLAAE